MTKAYKVFCVLYAAFIVMAFASMMAVSIQMYPVIAGDSLIEESQILSRSQMTAWIIWMNTAFVFGLGCIIFSMIGKWLKKD